MSIYINPQDSSIETIYIGITNYVIVIETNIPKILSYIIDPCVFIKEEDIHTYHPNYYHMVILKCESICPKYISDRDVLKLDETIAADIHPNIKYTTSFYDVVVYNYPNNSVVITSKNNQECTILSSNEDVLIFYAKAQFKKFLVEIMTTDHYFSLHASAVELDGYACLFLGDSFAGKSTISYNLSERGCRLLNDDLVFIRQTDTFIAVRGCPIKPNIREDSVKYLVKALDFANCYNSSYQDSFYCFTKELYLEECKLAGIFLPVKGKNNLNHIDSNLTRKVLANSAHKWYHKNSSLFESLSKIPIHEINLDDNEENWMYIIRDLIEDAAKENQ